MPHIDTDYLVVGAGASGMAFVDTMLSLTDARFVLVDRELRPGGHWLHAYPFVQLHQPSANYGVPSRRLGEDRIDTDGPNAGFYDRASAPEICAYFASVLDEHLATGRVTFLGGHDYRGRDGAGHAVVPLDGGEVTTVSARKVVDATYVESEIPSRHAPSYLVDDGVRLVPPNDLPDAAASARSFTVVGAGKTASDTCTWLVDSGVEPDRIRWVKPREVWMFDRAGMQPLDLLGAYMQMQAHWVRAAAVATTGHEFAAHLADNGVLVRVDETVRADMFRGAIISEPELKTLRSIEDVVRRGRVRRITGDGLVMDQGEVPARPGELYVNCTARGVRDTGTPDVFAADTITLAYVTIGLTPYSAATVAAVEALSDGDDAEKNRLTPTMRWSGRTEDTLELAYAGMSGLSARGRVPEIAAWNDGCRLNPAAGLLSRMSEPAIAAALTSMMTDAGPAMRNLHALVG
jgi:hypothetical protein